MPSTFQFVGGALYAEKPAAGKFDYTLTWKLEAGDAIASATWLTDPVGLVKTDESHTTNETTAWLDAGTAGTRYLVRCRITTTEGRKDEQSFTLLVTDPKDMGAGIPTGFPSWAEAIAEFRRDRLMTLMAQANTGVPITDDFLMTQLRAAEKEISRRLGVFTYPVEMIPPGTPQSEIDALALAGTPMAEEPGYDYDPDLFMGNTFGAIDLRHAPAIRVTRIWFIYPGPPNSIWDVPTDWVRLDKQPGLINLVPQGTPIQVPLNAFILSAIGGGRQVPLMINVRYRAGLENAARDYPDLLQAIMQAAALDIYNQKFHPSSGSVSADGLSQSISRQAKDYREQMEPRLKQLRMSIRGLATGMVIL